jgi:hypothetical protein
MQIDFEIPENSHELCKENFEHAYELANPPFLFINKDLARIAESKKYPLLAGFRSHSTYIVRHYSCEESGTCVELERLLCPDLKLYSTGSSGRVLFRFRFNIFNEHHKKNGIATKLIASEEEHIAKKWHADEIHTIIGGQGFLAWTRPRFNYAIAHFDLLRLRADCVVREYVTEENARKLNTVEDFPREFWKCLSGIKDASATFYKTVD